MAPDRSVKTYERKAKNKLDNISKSVDAVNALFAQNIKKRIIGRKRKAKLKLKELPPRKENYLTDDSLKVSADDTFDKVVKGKIYNEVKIGSFVKLNSSDSEVSKSKVTQVVSFHSPVLTRSRLKQSGVQISEIDNSSSKELSIHQSKSSTLDKPVTSSLCIEKECKKLNFSSLSYIKLPKIVENKVSNDSREQVCSKIEASFEPIFSDTFRERHLVHSSTPCMEVPNKKIVVDTISPIMKSDSSNSSNLIEKSYDEIRKWDSNFPAIDFKDTSPVLHKQKGKRGKTLFGTKTGTTFHNKDWKLDCQPKVYLKCSDIITKDTKECDLISNEKRKNPLQETEEIFYFKGFTEKEQLFSLNCSELQLSQIDSLSSECKPKKSTSRKDKDTKKKVQIKTKKRGIVKRTIFTRSSTNSNIKKKKHTHKSLHKVESDTDKSSVNKLSRNSIKKVVLRGKSEGSHIRKKISINKKGRKTFVATPRSRKSFNNLQENEIIEKKSNRRTKNNYKTSVTTPENNNSTKEIHDKFEIEPTNDKSNCFITLRKRKIRRFTKNQDKNAEFKSTPSKMKKSVSNVNISKEILPEKEIPSDNPDNLNKNKSISGDSECGSSLLIDLTQDMEGNLTESSSNVQLNNSNLGGDNQNIKSFTLKDFNRFEEICNNRSQSMEEDFDTRNNKLNLFRTSNLKKISSLTKQCLTSLLRDGKVSTTPLSDQQNVNLTVSNNKDGLNIETNCMQKNNRIINGGTCMEGQTYQIQNYKTPVRSKSKNSKIIVLSDITLKSGRVSSISDELSRRYQSVMHDHSYCYSPMSKNEVNIITPVSSIKTERNSSEQNSCILDESLRNNSLSDIVETSLLSESNDVKNPELSTSKNHFNNKNKFNKKHIQRRSINLKPGKSYRRSLTLLKRCAVVVDVLNPKQCPNDCICLKCQFRGKLNQDQTRTSVQIVPAEKTSYGINSTLLETYARHSCSYVQEEELIQSHLDDSIRNLSLSSRKSLVSEDRNNCLPIVTAKDLVLRRCGQTEPIPFEECYSRSALQNCQKIGEGVYGEVFLYRNQNGGTSVMKVIPIEGDLMVNGERQKKFEEILSEIVIAMELSNLRNFKKNTTSSFSEVQKVRCTQGCYPDRLIDLWELYDETRRSENDSPQMFPSDQLYIVLELANGGQDLESYVFNNAMQAFSMFKQTACALAVAENQLKFEHRDLHWGNILLSNVEKNTTVHYRLDGKDIDVDTYGVQVTIIDFTLSRMEFDGVVIFNDLSLDDELFVAKGDYQFEIYRLMQKNNGNNWKAFEPYSNILWLHYVLDKAISSALRYKNPRTKIHREYLGRLKKFKDEILSFHSVVEFVNNNFV